MSKAFDTVFAAILAEDEDILSIIKDNWPCILPNERRLLAVLRGGGGTVSGEVNVSNDAFGVGWNGETITSPSQNAVYDILVAMLADISAIVGSAPSTDNKGMTCLLATAQGDPLTASGLTGEPVGYAGGVVNNQWWLCGDGVKTKDFYWSGDGGTTPRAYGAVTTGDIPYLGDTGAALGGTTVSDLFSALYNVIP